MKLSRELLRHYATNADFQTRPAQHELIGAGIDPVTRNPFVIQFQVSAAGVIEWAGYDDGNIASMACRAALAYLVCLSRGRHRSQVSRGIVESISAAGLPVDVVSAVIRAQLRALSTENDSIGHRADWPGYIRRGRGLMRPTHFADWRSRDVYVCGFEFTIGSDQRIVEFYYHEHSIGSNRLRLCLPVLARAIEGMSIVGIEEVCRLAAADRKLAPEWQVLDAEMGREALLESLSAILSPRRNTNPNSRRSEMEWGFHFEFPYHQGIPDHVMNKAKRTHPPSGDIVEMGCVISDRIVESCYFDAHNSTALCRIAASMIAERVEGMSVDSVMSCELLEVLSTELEANEFPSRLAPM